VEYNIGRNIQIVKAFAPKHQITGMLYIISKLAFAAPCFPIGVYHQVPLQHPSFLL
jgi:hypothetical protein